MPSGHRPIPTPGGPLLSGAGSPETQPSLPPHVRKTVPLCAHSCLSYYIGEEFSCPPDDLSCLCSQYSSDGFTLGELAYVCLRLECSQLPTQKAVAVYDVCAVEEVAAQPTHSTLTLPATSLPSVRSTTANLSSRPSTFATTTRSVSTTESTPYATSHAKTVSPRTTSTVVSSTTQHSSSTPTSSETAQTSSPASTSPKLTPGQTVGISIAVAVVVAIMAVIFCIIYSMRRRRKASSEFDEKTRPDDDEFTPRSSPSTDSRTGLYQHPFGSTSLPAELDADPRRSFRQKEAINQHSDSKKDCPLNGRPANVSRGPPNYQQNLTDSRRVSKLLPDRPSIMRPPPPPRPARPPYMRTPATIFEEEVPVQVSRQPNNVVSPPMAFNSSARRPHYPAQPVRPLPPLSLHIPPQAPRFEPRASNTRKPVPILKDEKAEKDCYSGAGSRAVSDNSENSLLDYYRTAQAGSPEIYYDMNTHRPVPAAIVITKAPSRPSRPRPRRESTASDTSFESADTDEPTPPEEIERRLTPVLESPGRIVDIRYPKVPRSANQIVPRSPPQPQTPIRRVSVAERSHGQKSAQAPRCSRGHPVSNTPMTYDSRMTRGSTLSTSTVISESPYMGYGQFEDHGEFYGAQRERAYDFRGSPPQRYGRAINVVGKKPGLKLRVETQSPGRVHRGPPSTSDRYLRPDNDFHFRFSVTPPSGV